MGFLQQNHKYTVLFNVSIYTLSNLTVCPTVVNKYDFNTEFGYSHLLKPASLFSALFDDDVSSPVASWD